MKQAEPEYCLHSIRIDEGSLASTLNSMLNKKNIQNNKFFLYIAEFRPPKQQNNSVNNHDGLVQANGLSKLQQFAKYIIQHSKEAKQFFSSSPELVKIFACVLTKFLQNSKCADKRIIKQTQALITQAIISQQKMLQDFNVIELYLSLVYAQTLYVCKGTKQDKINFLPKFILRVELLQKHLKCVQKQFQYIRKIFKYGSKIIIETKPKIQQEKNLSKYIQRDSHFKFLPWHKKLQMPQTNDYYTRYYKVLLKYSYVDPQNKEALIQQCVQYFHQGIGHEHILQLFKIVKKLMNQNIYENLEKQTMEELIKMSRCLDQKKLNLFKQIFNIILQKPENSFLERNQNYLLNFSLHEQLKIFLFSVYYDFMCKTRSVSDSVLNAIVIWNIQLSLVPAQNFIPSIIKSGIYKISSDTQLMLSQNPNPLSVALQQKIIQYKIKEILNSTNQQSTQFNQRIFNKIEPIYYLYTKQYIELLTGTSFYKFQKYLVNSVVIVQTVEIVRKIHTYTYKILERAIKNQIYQQKFLSSFCLLNSIIQMKKITQIYRKDIYRYFVMSLKSLSLSQSKLLNFIQYLVSIFKMFKNAFNLFLILASCLIYISLPTFTVQNCTSILQQIIKIIENRNFAKTYAYCQENLKILLLISFTSFQQIKKLSLKILSLFSAMLSRVDIDTVLYMFDNKIFASELDIFGVIFPDFNNEQFILHCLQTVDYLLKAQNVAKNFYYLTPCDNSLHFIPIRHAKHKNSLALSFRILINPQVCYNSAVELYGSSQSQQGSIQKHRMSFKNRKIIYYNRITKQILGSTEELSDQIYGRSILISIQVADSKLLVAINKVKIVDVNYQFVVDSLRFDLFGDIMIKDMKWKVSQNQQRIINFQQSFQILPSEAQIKIAKLQRYQIKNFSQKLNMLYFCAYLTQIIKTNHSNINLNKFYGNCYKLLYFIEGTNKDQFTKTQQLCINRLFRLILTLTQNDTYIQMPSVPIKVLQQTPIKKLYQIFINTIFDFNYMIKCTDKCKTVLYDYLMTVLFSKNSNFRVNIECKQSRIFTNICNLILHVQGKIRDNFAQLIKKIIFNHENNQFLLKKLSTMFYLSQSKNTNQTQYLRILLDNILGTIFQVVAETKSVQNSQTQTLGKYILSENKTLQYIFMMLNVQIKLKVLQFMINDTQLNLKFHQVFQQLQEEDLLKLSSWIIVYCKKTMYDFFDANRKTNINLQNMLFTLKQISRVYQILQQEDQKQQCVTILSMFFNKLSKIGNQKFKPQIIQEIQNFYYYSDFIHLLEIKICKCNKEVVQLPQQNLLNTYFNSLFLKMPKLIIMKALTQFRLNYQYMVESCKFILKLDPIDILPPYSLSSLLQYLIQILFKLRQSENVSQAKQLGFIIYQYICKLLKNYSKVSKLKQPLFYTYPKLEKKVKLNDQKIIKQTATSISTKKLYELKGGICFKMICIVFHLMQILPQVDFSQFIHFYLGNVEEIKQNQAVYRVVNDFIQVRNDTKNRSHIYGIIKQVQTQHREYFENNDQQIVENSKSKIESRTSITSIKSNIEDDLTAYYADFILMKLFLYLQNRCVEDQITEQELKINESYSNFAIKYLKFCEIIWDQISQKNTQSLISYEDVKDLTNLLSKDQQMTISEMLLSPDTNCRRLHQNHAMGFLQISKDIQNQFCNNTPSKMKKRRSTINIDLTSGKKKKQIFSNIQSNIYTWSKEAKQKNLHQYFRDQAKQLFLMELFHQLYIVSTSIDGSKQIQHSKIKKIHKFLEDQDTIVEKQKKIEQKYIKKMNDRVKLVQGFTCSFAPHLKLKGHALPNGTYPFLNTLKQEKPNIHTPSSLYSSSLNVSVQNIPNQQDITSQTVVSLQITQDTEEAYNICEISTRKGVYYCEWELHSTRITFLTKDQKIVTSKKLERTSKYGSPKANLIAGKGKKIQLHISDILQIFYRKYNQIRNNSIQFFLKNGASLYAIFYTQQSTHKFLEKCKKKYKFFNQIKIVQNYIKQFQNQAYTQKWAMGEISNFDYLMLINKYAGRTFNDLNQYYIFPWILQDYTSDLLDISNPKIYRDLKKPIGALNPEKLKRYFQKYENQTQTSQNKYLYGSHYSTSLFLYYYLVRLEPFTSLHKDMQSGVFDAPDRLFSSIQNMWECLMSQSTTSDIKQAIPEFYYFPVFLNNINNEDFGAKQTGDSVSNVDLPRWASSSTNFIHKMRICMESDYVSSNLNYWIDLIFGKDQDEISKFNLFHPLSYVKNIKPQLIKLENLQATMNQITFFGQNPNILFQKQHPKKKIKMMIIKKQSINLALSQDLSINLGGIRESFINCVQQKLDMINYVSSIGFKNKKTIEMVISGISKSSTKKTIDLDMQNSIQSLIRNIHKTQANSMKRLLSQNYIDIPEIQSTTTYEINEHEITFRIGVKQKTQIVKTIQLNINFAKIAFNETVFVVYGGGPLLRIYNWTEQIVWEYRSQIGQISQCFLQYGLIFFTSSAGKLWVYDFFYGCKQLIYQYDKQTYQVNMFVYPENKYITKKNENYYKFLLVADKRKIVLISYIHKVGKYSLTNN